MEQKNNLFKLAELLSELVGKEIGMGQIHSMRTSERAPYIQAPEEGAPMLLHHYRGPFFVDIHPEDYRNMAEGTITAEEYINTANWMVGYYWGGGSMLRGGYYQPLDIKDPTIKDYLKELACRGRRFSSGYMPKEESCQSCEAESCSFCPYSTQKKESSISEEDPRVSLFEALSRRFKQQFEGYEINFSSIGAEQAENMICLVPNVRFSEAEPYSFRASVSETAVRNLMMRKIVPENWDEYAANFKFVMREGNNEVEATLENLEWALQGADIYIDIPEDRKEGFFKRIINFFKEIFKK